MSVMRTVPVGTGADGDTQWLTGVDATTIDQLATVKVKEGSADALRQGMLLVSSGYAEHHDLKVGSTLAVTYPDGARGSLAVGGVLEANTALGGLIAPDAVVGPHASAGSGLEKVLVRGPTARTPS